MKRAMITGAGGFVGSRAMCQLNDRFELLAFPRGILSRADEPAVAAEIERAEPEIIFHTAAISDTQYSQDHPEESHRANVELPIWLARAAKRIGAKLICFSSDQVYTGLGGLGPFNEETEVHPVNVYGRHKLEAEERVLDILPTSVMLRATWMYDLPGYGLPTHANLLLVLMRAAMSRRTLYYSSHDFRAVTYVRSAIEALVPAANLQGGVYNFGSENNLSMYETALYFARTLNLTIELEDSEAQRSLSIDCGKLHRAGIDMGTAQEGLPQCIEDYGLRGLREEK